MEYIVINNLTTTQQAKYELHLAKYELLIYRRSDKFLSLLIHKIMKIEIKYMSNFMHKCHRFVHIFIIFMNY